MFKVILVLLFLLFPAVCFCEDAPEEESEPPREVTLEEPVELKYNPHTGLFEEVKPAQPKKSPPEEAEEVKTKEGQKLTVQPQAVPPAKKLVELKYNPYTGEFQEARPGEEIRFNPLEAEWQYQGGKAEARLNPYTGEFEQAGPDETLQYNPVEDTWSYQ